MKNQKYTVEVKVFDGQGNEVFSAGVGNVEHSDLFLPGYVTPGLKTVSNVLASSFAMKGADISHR